MGDARNVYPRLCWGCLGTIEAFKDDSANLNYGGVCYRCAESDAGDLPRLRDVLQGQTERMNSVVERDDLLHAVKMITEC